jgi:exodeoxyribonuclease V alpha subunit
MQMNAKGTVSSIVFYNSENGYTVLQLDTTDGDTVTVVGNLPSLAVGEVLEVAGTVTVHNKYGEQLSVETYTVSAPTNKDGIIKYLSSGLIKGVGEVTAKNIYAAFGADTLGVIESNPTKLATVKGISQKKAMDIYNSVAELKKMQQQIMFLQGFSITTNLALKIYNIYKQNTKSVVSTNPYRLIDDIDGVGFSTADKIAQSMGHAIDSEFRIRSALIYCLKDTADKQGNTYMVLSELIERAESLLGLTLADKETLTEEILTKMILEPVIKTIDIDGERCVALTKYFYLEQGIANSLLRTNREAKRVVIDVDSLIKQFETINKIEFHASQLSAVKSAVTSGVTVITGGPGTGKTTIIKCIVELLTSSGLAVELCAPTGRAAKRLSESTGRDAKTIHRLLGSEYKDGRMLFKYNAKMPLPSDVVIVDEVSMCDVTIMHSLLKAIKQGARLVLVGDKDQLPSVGAGNVLSDIIKSRIFDVRYLTFIYRQSEDSLIVSNAHLVNQCKMPVIDNSSRDFFVISEDSVEIVATTVVGLVSTRLPPFTGVDAREIQVLSPLKGGLAGVDNLNILLQNKLNPKLNLTKELKSGKNVFRTGDRVMQTVNNYELAYTRAEKSGAVTEGQGVFNGDIGFVTAVDLFGGTLDVLFDDNRLCRYTQLDLSDLQLAYAVTVHKSQGCEFDVVVIPLVAGPPTIINKNLLYTAITRAKKLVVLVGSRRVLGMMIRNNYITKRLTLLNKFLIDEDSRYNKFFKSEE